MTLSLYYLQQYYQVELMRDFCDVGTFKLKREHRHRRMDADSMEMLEIICRPEDVVEFVKGKISSLEAETSAKEEDVLPANATKLADEEKENSAVSTQRALAMMAIKQGRVHHCLSSRSFTIEGSKGDKYAVTLYPEKCVCPALGTCYHILAAKLSIDQPIGDKKRIYNLTQLHKNAKKRPNKRAGKKIPDRATKTTTQ